MLNRQCIHRARAIALFKHCFRNIGSSDNMRLCCSDYLPVIFSCNCPDAYKGLKQRVSTLMARVLRLWKCKIEQLGPLSV